MTEVNPLISISMHRDTALQLLGWIGAHRRDGDWEPHFVGQAVIALNLGIAVAGGNDE